MSWNTVFKLAALAACVMVVLQVVFYFVFQIIGYDSFWLSINLIVSVSVAIVLLTLWRVLRRAVS